MSANLSVDHRGNLVGLVSLMMGIVYISGLQSCLSGSFFLSLDEMEKITKEDIRRSLNSEQMNSNNVLYLIQRDVRSLGKVLDAKLGELVRAGLISFVTNGALNFLPEKAGVLKHEIATVFFVSNPQAPIQQIGVVFKEVGSNPIDFGTGRRMHNKART